MTNNYLCVEFSMTSCVWSYIWHVCCST